MTSVSLATLVTIGTLPVLVSMLEWVTGRRRPDRRMLGTTALALAGDRGRGPARRRRAPRRGYAVVMQRRDPAS